MRLSGHMMATVGLVEADLGPALPHDAIEAEVDEKDFVQRMWRMSSNKPWYQLHVQELW